MSRSSTASHVLFSLLASISLAFAGVGCGGDSPDNGGGEPRILSFEVEPDRLDAPGDVTVRWKTSAASSITLLSDGEAIDLLGQAAGAGEVTFRVERSVELELSATSSAGRLATERRTVFVEEAPGIAGLDAPAVVEADEFGIATARIAWRGVVRASELTLESTTLDPIPLDPTAEEGDVEVSIREDTTFSLIARRGEREAKEFASVRVVDPPSIVRFEADRTKVGTGDTVLLEWETIGSSVELWVDGARVTGVEPQETTGSFELPILLSATLELHALNELGTRAVAEVDVEVGPPSLSEFVGSASSIWLGEHLDLSWESEGGSQASLEVEGAGVVICERSSPREVERSSCAWQPPAAGSYVVTLTIVNGSGSKKAAWEVWAGTGPRIERFDADLQEVSAGEPIVLSWEVAPDPAGEAARLRLSDDRGETYEVEGAEGSLTAVIEAPGTVRFTLEASTSDERSTPAQAQASIVVLPLAVADLQATPNHFDDSVDEEVVLTWTTLDAVTARLVWIAEGGERELLEIPERDREAGRFTFVPREGGVVRLVATNVAGRETASEVAITVAPTEVIEFDAEPMEITQGQPVLLRWRTRMADEVRLDIANGAYLREETAEPYIDAAANGGTRVPLTTACGADLATAGCAFFRFPGDFQFPFGGSDFDGVRVYTTGVMHFGEESEQAFASNPNNANLPTEEATAWVHLAPFWDALAWDTDRYPTGNVHYLLREDPAGDSLVIQWKDLGFNFTQYRRASVSFEVVLWRDGSFEYRYGIFDARGTSIPSSQLEGGSATIGYQLPDRSAADTIAYNTTKPMLGPPSQRSFRYRPTPAIASSGSLLWHPFAEIESLPVTLQAVRGEAIHSLSRTIKVSRKPTIQLTPWAIEPTLAGTPFRLGWKTFNANALSVVDDSERVRCEAGSPSAVEESFCELSEAVDGRYRYRVRATGAHGFVHELPVDVAVYQPFGILSFEADDLEVEKGQSVTLSWETFNTSELKLLADGVELYSETEPSEPGSFSVVVERNTEYTLRSINSVGVVEEKQLTVEIWDISMDISSSATTVRAGQPITVSIDARVLDGGAPAPVFGTLPLVEQSGSGHSYSDISSVTGATRHPAPIGPAGTDATAEIPLPSGFSFPYMGSEYTRLRAFIDGYVTFDMDATSSPLNQRLPYDGSAAGKSVHLAPFWDDLHSWGIGDMWSAKVDDETFIVQWKQVSTAEGTLATTRLDLNFQLVLFRSGAFEFRYGKMDRAIGGSNSTCDPSDCSNEANGSSATIGYQWNQGQSGYTLHFGGTKNGRKNPPFPGGLANRTFRYEPFSGSGTFSVQTNDSSTFEFCSLSAGTPVCKKLDAVVSPFGFDSLIASSEELSLDQPVTFSWKTHGGTRIDVLIGDQLVHTTADLATIDQGSWTDSPAQNTTYVFELSAGGRRERLTRLVEVKKLSISATAGASAKPGAPITLSWTLGTSDPSVTPILIGPMEERSELNFYDLDLTIDPEATQLIGANSDNGTSLVSFGPGFKFKYFGVDRSEVRVATDGYLTFEGTTSTPTNQIIPTTNATYKAVSLAPFWEDLHSRLSGRIYGKQIDADRYVIQWSRMSLRWGSSNNNEGDLNFMVVLHRDGRFEYRYGDMIRPPLPGTATDCYPTSCENESNGSSATIGYQSLDGRLGSLLHFGGINRAATQKPILGGLSRRSWRFTPHSGSGSMQLTPADTTTYSLCAYDPGSGDVECAPGVGVDVPWGIDLFEATPKAPSPGAPLTLAWSVVGVDSLRVLVDGAELASYQGASLPLIGSLPHTPGGKTTYVLEASSLGRIVTREQVAVPRAFDLQISAPPGPWLPGEKVPVSWTVTNASPGELAIVTPMSEIDAGPGKPGAFVDLSSVVGAEKVAMSGARGFGTIDLPFSFPYLGSRFTSVQAFVDGYLSFAGVGGNSNGSNTILPEGTGRVHLAPFWDGFAMSTTGVDAIWSHSPNSDTTIIQWKSFSLGQGSSASNRYDINFEVVLHSDGRFEYRYGDVKPPPPPFSSNDCIPSSCLAEANGSSATIGYQSADGKFASNLHLGSRSPPPSGFGEVSMTSDGVIPFPGGLSHRSFAYSPSSSGTAEVVIGRTGLYEVCGALGEFSECKAVMLQAMAEPGELAITELMLDPVDPDGGQWFELRNLTRRPIDLKGFSLFTEHGSHSITQSLPVAPGGFVTLASSSGVGFSPDYVFGGDLPMGRLADELVLRALATPIASVKWGVSWQIPRGGSLALDPSFHQTGVVDHSAFEQWCGGGAGGSPGQIGSGCLNAFYDVDPNSNHPFIDIGGTGARFRDVEGVNLLAKLPSTGFRVSFFDNLYSRIWVSSNGWLSFSDVLPTTSPNTVVPSKLPRGTTAMPWGPLLSAFWDTLSCDPRSYDCRFLYERRVVGGQDVLILQWDGYRRGSVGEITFQAQLWEDGDVVVAFAPEDGTSRIGSTEWFAYQGGYSWVGIEGEEKDNVLIGHHKRMLGFDRRSFHFRRK